MRGMQLPLNEQIWPCFRVQKLFELKFVPPKVVAQATEIIFAKGWLIEQDLVFVIVDTDYSSVMTEELRTDADYNVSYLVIGRTFLEV
jgi:hypothetical protein